MRDLFQMNDWEIGRFFRATLGVQALVRATIGREHFNVQIPLIRHLVRFFYLLLY